MELMDSYLKKHGNDEGLCQMALMCVGSLTDAGEWMYSSENLIDTKLF